VDGIPGSYTGGSTFRSRPEGGHDN